MRTLVLIGLVALLVVSIGLGWFFMTGCVKENNSCMLGKCCDGLSCCADKTCRKNCGSGTLSLSILPEKALVSDTLNITIFGLIDCAGKNISVKDNGAVVCMIESGKSGGSCQINASSIVGTHVFTAELDINMDGNISTNEQSSKLVTIEDVCSGNITLSIPVSVSPSTNVIAQISGLMGCSDRTFDIIVDTNPGCTGNISGGAGNCNFTAPAAMGTHIIKANVDINKDNDTNDAGEHTEKVLTISYTCSGTIGLNMAGIVAPSTVVNATISGLSHCESKRAYIRQNNCSGADIGYCDLSGTNCTISFTAASAIGTYGYTACLDMNGNTMFETGEQTSKNLTVGCIGNISMALSPSTAEPNATVNATVSGLNGCSTKIVNISLNNTLQCQVNLSAGSYCAFTAPSSTGAYVINAKIDKNDNNITTEEGESVNTNLTVATVLHFTETRLTTGTSNKMFPKIQGTTVVYDDDRNNNSDIFSFAIGGAETQITTENSSQQLPAVWGNKIVWTDNRNVNSQIYMWDGAEHRLTNTSNESKYPAIYENTVVYQDNRNGNQDIYSYNLGTSIEAQITSDAGDQIFPAIWGSKIVWADYRSGNADIYMWDGYNITITNATGDQTFPSVYGTNVVYQDNRNGNNEIYMWNGSAEVRITNNPSSQERPSIYGNYIVWQDNRNTDWDIYVYDLARNTETKLTNSTADQKFPVIYGNTVVYQDNRNGNSDVYMTTLS